MLVSQREGEKRLEIAKYAFLIEDPRGLCHSTSAPACFHSPHIFPLTRFHNFGCHLLCKLIVWPIKCQNIMNTIH